MGINARIETERGHCLRELLDPSSRLMWSLLWFPREGTTCLRFIDPYGNTVFNGLQMPVLLAEFQTLGAHLATSSLAVAKQEYLEQAASRPPPAIQHAQAQVE